MMQKMKRMMCEVVLFAMFPGFRFGEHASSLFFGREREFFVVILVVMFVN